MSEALSGLRIGIGHDMHAFADAGTHRPLMLGGVAVDYQIGLAGHSDADVVAHAVADALLGAARLGDIGEHFPDSDPSLLGADSLMLLARAAGLVREHGYQVLDIDCVVLAEAPKLSPYRDEMRQRLAQAIGVETDRVGIKATTTEGLGAVGRGEGIAATAVALLLAKAV